MPHCFWSGIFFCQNKRKTAEFWVYKLLHLNLASAIHPQNYEKKFEPEFVIQKQSYVSLLFNVLFSIFEQSLDYVLQCKQIVM